MADPIEMEAELTIDGVAYSVIWLEAREALDEIGYVRCELTDGTGGPEPSAIIGKKMDVVLRRKDGGQERRIAGYVTEAERSTPRGDEAADLGTRLLSRPRLFRLEQRADCRIFQEISAPDMLKKVLAKAGVPETDQKWELEGDYPERTFTAQYRESDFQFMRRVLSEEGIAFTVDSSSGLDVVVFFDTDRSDIEGSKAIPFGLGAGLSASRDAVSDVTHEKLTAPGKVHLRDYDFERPRLALDSKVEADDEGERSLEVYCYPGRYTDPKVGDRYANVLLESLRARREMVGGTTSSLRLSPGRKFELEEHPYEPLNHEYLVVEVDYRYDARRWASGAAGPGERGSRVRFRAIPTEGTPYRPPRVPRAALVPGAQTAVTTGAPGSEIHPDKYGRVKVHFPWDREGKRDDSSSLWIRTCQLPLGGSMLTPRVGWEVYLNCIEGDPDLPFVFGRMYNATSPPPYALPKNKTRMSIQTATTPGGGSTNEIRMEDKAGAEEMFMNASRDASVSVGNNATLDVGNNETRSVGSNQSLAVTGSLSSNVGADQSLRVGGNQSVNVATFMADDVGSHTLTISGNRDIKAGGDHKRTVAGASTLSIGGMQVDLVAGSSDEEALSTMDETIGAALVELTASNRTVTTQGARSESVGAAKVIIAAGGRAVQVGGSLKQNVAGAILTKIKAGRDDSSSADYMEIAGGAQLIKATNVVFLAKSLLSIVMGGSTITLTPASVSIAGTKITLDGDCTETAALITDN